MEVILYKGKWGVMINRLSECVVFYDGDIWWLLLFSVLRSIFE